MQFLEVLRATREHGERTAGSQGADITALVAPEFRVPDFKSLLDPLSPEQQAVRLLEPEFEEAKKRAPLGKEHEAPHESKCGTIPIRSGCLPAFFWFAAAAILFIQRPSLGALVLVFQITPFPLLAFAVPYSYFWVQDVKWVR